jgi:hypothetical protein
MNTVTIRCRCGRCYQFENRRLPLRQHLAVIIGRRSDPRVIGDHEPTPACGDRKTVTVLS